MRENNGFTVACCLIALAWLYAAYDANHANSLLAMLLSIGGISAWLGLVVLALYRIAKRNYLPWRKRITPFLLLFFPIATSISYGFISKLFSSADWLLVERYDFTGSDNMLFKQDGEYEYWRPGPLGRSAIVQGHYTRRDSLLIMQPNAEALMPEVATIAIRPYSSFQQLRPARLVALDGKGRALATFRIKEHTEP